MKTVIRIAILTIVIIVILLSVTPQQDTPAKVDTLPSVKIHWMLGSKTAAYNMQQDTVESLIGDCLADRVTGDLYPQPDAYCLVTPVVNVLAKDTQDTQDTTVNVPTPDAPTVEPPVIEPEEPKQDNRHCNNGEGNGAEGCSPGRGHGANNDENQSTPKEDKSKK